MTWRYTLRVFLISFCYLLGPLLAVFLCRKLKFFALFGPVGVCYAVGMAMANSPLAPEPAWGGALASGTVLIALPFMLISCDVKSWLSMAKKAILSATVYFLLVPFVAFLAIKFIFTELDEGPAMAAMLVGTYVGSMPNLAAVGSALKVSPDNFVLTQASDIIVGGVYFLFLISIGARFFAAFLLPYKSNLEFKKEEDSEVATKEENLSLFYFLKSLGVVIIIVGLGAGMSFFVPKTHQQLIAILGITLFSISASFFKPIKQLPKTFEIGEFIFLYFCVAVGSLTDFQRVFTSSPDVILLAATILYGSLFIHIIICYFLKIDRDTALITSAAGIFSPAMIGPLVSVTKNREMLLTGVTAGLLGLTVGTFMGLILYWTLSF